LRSSINIILYYLINKVEITDQFLVDIEGDINKNYSPEEKNRIITDLNSVVSSNNLPPMPPGVIISPSEISFFLESLNNRIKKD
jgi:hypothetical protein